MSLLKIPSLKITKFNRLLIRNSPLLSKNQTLNRIPSSATHRSRSRVQFVGGQCTLTIPPFFEIIKLDLCSKLKETHVFNQLI